MPEAIVIYFGQEVKVVCDGNCGKAWGICSRPRFQLLSDEDNFAYLADGELDDAPADPGTYEGGHAKPTSLAEFPNKWCVRECERCAMSNLGEYDLPLTVRNLSERVYNLATRKHGANSRRERVAAVQHETWSSWMFHLFDVCGLNQDGTVTIPADEVARWQRQMNTPYSELSESEQASDLRQANKVIAVL